MILNCLEALVHIIMQAESIRGVESSKQVESITQIVSIKQAGLVRH